MAKNTDMSAEQMVQVARALDALGPATPVIPVEPPREYECAGCGEKKPLGAMQRITGTTLAPQVIDVICRACWREHAPECRKLARVVCVTCKEVVGAVEPHKEKSGYAWKPGSFAHVARCPVCNTDEETKFDPSPVAEKIAFYKANGIPYETAESQAIAGFTTNTNHEKETKVSKGRIV